MGKTKIYVLHKCLYYNSLCVVAKNISENPKNSLEMLKLYDRLSDVRFEWFFERKKDETSNIQ